MRYLLLIITLFLSGCLPPYSLQDGIKSFRAEDYRRAFIRLKPAALHGQRDAQYAIGYMYYYGQGVVEDRVKAIYWIDCAAKAGQPDAITAIRILQDQHQEK